MPMYQALIIVTVGLGSAGVGAAVNARLRADLLRPIFWSALLSGSALMSLVSGLVASTRHAGTGLTTAYGWPKPFYFQYISETGEPSSGWHLIYFLGNSLVFSGLSLILWTLWRVLRR